MFAKERIACIGAGNMGSAMLGGIFQQALLQPKQVIVADKDAERLAILADQYGVAITTDNAVAVEDATIVLLAVKPQIFPFVVEEVNGNITAELVISIMAGVTIATLVNHLGIDAVVRSMPNTPGQIGLGMTAWTSSPNVDELRREQAATILGSLGETMLVPEERFLDMATAMSGSGPAYMLLILEAMTDAGVHMGFSRAQAEQLAIQTMLGTAHYARESEDSIADLRNQVTSPGGTTAAALHELEKGALRHTISAAIWAAYKRSIELGD